MLKKIKFLLTGWLGIMSGSVAVLFGLATICFWPNAAAGKCFAALAGVSLICFVFCLINRNFALAQTNLPVLAATLVIDKITPTGIIYHYVIRNIGNVAATNICFTDTFNESYSGTWASRAVGLLLAPGAEMKHGSPIEMNCSKGDALRFKLLVFYSAPAGESKSRFVFHIHPELVAPATFAPDFSSEPEESFAQAEREQGVRVASQLDEPIGGVSFRHTLGNALVVKGGEKRSIKLDMLRRMAIFKLPAAGDDVEIALPLESLDPNHFYFILVTWNEDGGLLRVDDREVEHPPGWSGVRDVNSP